MDGVAALQYILDRGVEGVIVECGVGNGHFEHMWMVELNRRGVVREMYLYDTFAGLVRPTEKDFTCPDAVLYQMSNEEVMERWESEVITDSINGWCFDPLRKVQARLRGTGYPEAHVHYVIGDVMKTLRDDAALPEKIAILRLDTDWYESSKWELERLYDRVVSGGVVIFDDYYHWDGQRRATDEFFEARGIRPNLVAIHNGKTAAMLKP